jgi:hypothetical protein
MGERANILALVQPSVYSTSVSLSSVTFPDYFGYLHASLRSWRTRRARPSSGTTISRFKRTSFTRAKSSCFSERTKFHKNISLLRKTCLSCSTAGSSSHVPGSTSHASSKPMRFLACTALVITFISAAARLSRYAPVASSSAPQECSAVPDIRGLLLNLSTCRTTLAALWDEACP